MKVWQSIHIHLLLYIHQVEFFFQSYVTVHSEMWFMLMMLLSVNEIFLKNSSDRILFNNFHAQTSLTFHSHHLTGLLKLVSLK